MSGRTARRLRKKKIVIGAAAALLCAAPVAAEGGEFLVSLYPHFSFPVIKFDDSLTTGFGGGLRLTYRPVEYFDVYIQGDYKQYSFKTKQSVGNLSVVGATAGAGYHLPLTDRLGLNFDAGVGYYYSSYQKGKGSDKTSVGVQGVSVNGSVSVSYKIGPVVSVYGSAGASHYALQNSKFITAVDVNPGITVNLTKAFANKNNVSMGEQTLKPVFPVFYSWYNDNSFGSVEIANNEDAAITDVTVSFYQPQYMSQPRECASQAVLKKGEKIDVDLKAFFNEQMLNLSEKNDTMANIIVEYKYLGAKRSQTFPMVVPVYGRNNMSWEDDRCASAFVSSKDPAAMWFAKYVTSAVREDVRSGVPQNIQYVMAVFQALDQFGINYVKDPTSAFEDNVGTASIDFLQFPYQTLMYRGGDCDDLSILVCSLLESIGIKTAFITIPGHIYMAFDSGLTLNEAQNYFINLDEFIVDGDRVWVPLEITLSDEGFNKAWRKGAWEWTTASRTDSAMLYRMEDSWKIYKPVSVPGASAKFTLPEEKLVAKSFSTTVDEFVIAQITPQIAWYENRIATAPTAQNYNDFGVLYARYGLFEQAEEQFHIARNMKYLPAVLNTANLCYSKKEYSNATAWYNQVLKTDSSNNLAMLGLARCAYETGDYEECDLWYGTVYKNDKALAKQYSYLGAFESTGGRSFSLADRLENTVWLQSTDYNLRNGAVAGDGTFIAGAGAGANATAGVPELVEGPGASNQKGAQFAMAGTVVGVVSSGKSKKENDDEEDDVTGAGAGAGGSDGDNDDTYVGITSQLDFNILSAQDLANLAEDTIIEHGETLDDFDASAYSLSVRDDKLVDTTVVTSIMTDVPVREPSAQDIEAFGSEAALFSEADEDTAASGGIALDPESAILTASIEDFIRQIADPDFKIAGVDKAPVEGAEATTEVTSAVPELVEGQEPQTPEPVVLTDTTSVVPEPVEGPQNEVQSPTSNKNKKSHIGFAAIACALAAAITALFIGLKKKRKEK